LGTTQLSVAFQNKNNNDYGQISLSLENLKTCPFVSFFLVDKYVVNLVYVYKYFCANTHVLASIVLSCVSNEKKKGSSFRVLASVVGAFERHCTKGIVRFRCRFGLHDHDRFSRPAGVCHNNTLLHTYIHRNVVQQATPYSYTHSCFFCSRTYCNSGGIGRREPLKEIFNRLDISAATRRRRVRVADCLSELIVAVKWRGWTIISSYY